MRRSAETPLRPAHGDEGGSETQAEAQHHGKGRARGGMDGKPVEKYRSRIIAN